jgi:hypothetical protein
MLPERPTPTPQPYNGEVIQEIKRRLESGELLPLDEGFLFRRIRLMQKPNSDQTYSGNEIAELFGVRYAHLRKMISLCRTSVQSSSEKHDLSMRKFILASRNLP